MHKVLILLTLFSAVSCGNKKNKAISLPPIQTKALPAPEAPKVVEELRDLEVTQTETVNIKRKEQMISRYDCQGQLTSRKLETINSLSKTIKIKQEDMDKIWSYKLYNRRTKSRKQGFINLHGNFVVDYAPTLFNMRIKSGINEVEYTLYRCTEVAQNKTGPKVCEGELVMVKEGIIQLDVYYSSEVVPGEEHIHPSNCKDQST